MEHDNKILSLMEEEDDFEQGENLQTTFAIYFKKLLFSTNVYRKTIPNKKTVQSLLLSRRQENICLPKLSIEPFNGDSQHFLEFVR